MIIMPHIDGCTIVTENGFCSVMGHPFDIIAPSAKEVSVLEGNIHAGYYIELLKKIGVNVNVVPQKNPEKVFKEVK